MGGASGTYGEEEARQRFGGWNLREKVHLEGPGLDRLEDNIKMPPQELVV
jgi:hypothetical protein